MHRALSASRIMLLSMAMALLAGCGAGSDVDDPAVLEQRAKFLLDTEPEGVADVEQVREKVKNKSDEVALVGQIGGVDDPWSKGRAGFVVIDPTVANHNSDECHDAECPHCQKKNEAKRLRAIALVEFVEDGQVVPIEAKKLFRVKEGQLVVVRGRAKLNDDQLVIEADGLYIRE